MVPLITEIEGLSPLAIYHLKVRPNLTACGIPVLENDSASNNLYLPACHICFRKYYEYLGTDL